MRAYVVSLVVLAAAGSACLGGASHAATPGNGPRGHAAVRIVLADARDLRGTVVTLGWHPTVSSVALPGRTGGDPPVNLAAVGGGLVFYGRDGPYAFPGSLAGRSRRLHRGLYFVPSATPGRVWVAIEDPREPDMRLVGRVVEVTTTGRPVRSSRHRPPTRNIVAAARAGLVVETDRGLAIWDPRTGRTVRTLPGSFPAAVHGNLVAWCAVRCPAMHVTDVAKGADRVIPHVGRHRWEETYGGAISADGRYLALPIRVGGVQRVALADLRLGRSRLLRGPHLAAVYPALGWDPARDSLYYVTAGGSVARYGVDASRAVSLGVHVAGGFTNLAILRESVELCCAA
jgi:hypothetical protein